MNYVKEAEKYLDNYDDLKESLKNLKYDIGELEEDIKSIKAVDYSGMPHGSGAELPDDKLINKMFMLQKKKELYEETKKDILKINCIINRLPENKSKVLKAYYLKGYRGKTLEKEIGYSERQIYRDKAHAVRTLAVRLFGIGGLA